MKIFKSAEYPNMHTYCKLTTDSICNEIAGYTLEFSNIRNDKIEYGIKLPIFLNSFYKYVYLNNRIIKQQEFYQYYLSENRHYFEQNRFNQDDLLGLKARIYRTYPSLVRDIHFSTFLKENFVEAEIIYNRRLDVVEGIDIMIIYRGLFFGINLYTDTKRSNDVRSKKLIRHSSFSNVNNIDLPVDLSSGHKVGKFFLYGNSAMTNIKKIVQLKYKMSYT